ncbi:WW domain-containing oxidoreductase [Zancudomyces culisetae]|uniref:WW domain-containing oxidoreductase n=1 Tax=Zancudomyces culisetae TaxID=1213189 RepID=A0A1R1PRH9_ZANCU|nr:WW domain-containing oxidoreductase [Zancudomyces culisetae]|eukprot:OMH83567.1 WW domain-containing oxidoreductase [Zancudomyces culisetae]
MGFPPFTAEENTWVPTQRQDGKIALVTGSSRGIGFETAKTLAALGAHVVLVGNDPDHVFEAVIEQIVNKIGCERSMLEHMHVDLGSQRSILQFADKWRARKDKRIHILINNAGIPGIPGKTQDGWEMCWGINFIGSAMLTRLLLEFMTPTKQNSGDAAGEYHASGMGVEGVHGGSITVGESNSNAQPKDADSLLKLNDDSCDPARIVFVSSSAHVFTMGLPLDEKYLTSSGGGFFSLRYGESKLAVLMFARELARRLESGLRSPMRKKKITKENTLAIPDSGPLSGPIHVYVVHPGTTFSNFWNGFPTFIQNIIQKLSQSAEAGAFTSLYCATEPSISHQTGLYYADCKVAAPGYWVNDPEKSAKLWEYSSQWIGLDSSLF